MVSRSLSIFRTSEDDTESHEVKIKCTLYFGKLLQICVSFPLFLTVSVKKTTEPLEQFEK